MKFRPPTLCRTRLHPYQLLGSLMYPCADAKDSTREVGSTLLSQVSTITSLPEWECSFYPLDLGTSTTS